MKFRGDCFCNLILRSPFYSPILFRTLKPHKIEDYKILWELNLPRLSSLSHFVPGNSPQPFLGRFSPCLMVFYSNRTGSMLPHVFGGNRRNSIDNFLRDWRLDVCASRVCRTEKENYAIRSHTPQKFILMCEKLFSAVILIWILLWVRPPFGFIFRMGAKRASCQKQNNWKLLLLCNRMRSDGPEMSAQKKVGAGDDETRKLLPRNLRRRIWIRSVTRAGDE